MPDAAATRRLGEALAGGATAGRVLHLSGDLGSGKTTLVRGLLRALGHAGRVKSPSYALVEAYALSSINFYHFDFYRFRNESEWLSSGFQDYFNPGAFCVVEWPERAGSLLAPPDLLVRLEFSGEARTATVQAQAGPGESWQSELRSHYSSSR